MTETASKATILSTNEQRAMLGYPPYEDDEQADIPVKLLELKIKLAAVEAQLGRVSNLLGRTPT